MSDEASEVAGTTGEAGAARGAVIAGVVPDLPSRVLKEAARYARLLGAPLLVVHVDVTRFVTYEDPDGYVHSAPIDVNIAAGESELAVVRSQATALLDGYGVDWSVRQLVGDPALAIKQLAESVDARLLVVGTRKRGLGESIREFFTGSVAARLAHRQHRPILVVPLGDPVPDDEEIWPT
jgi:nucleotide-binding universal stress UspA family protein